MILNARRKVFSWSSMRSFSIFPERTDCGMQDFQNCSRLRPLCELAHPSIYIAMASNRKNDAHA